MEKNPIYPGKPERHIDLITRIIDAVLADAEVVWYDPDEFPEPGPSGL